MARKKVGHLTPAVKNHWFLTKFFTLGCIGCEKFIKKRTAFLTAKFYCLSFNLFYFYKWSSQVCKIDFSDICYAHVICRIRFV